MTEAAGGGSTHKDVVCPFCGLGCDDVSLTVQGAAVKAAEGVCGRAAALFSRSDDKAPSPRVAGKDVSLDEALRAAAEILSGARSAVYGGLGADVDGVRAIIKLASKTGGSVDHYASPGMFRNLATSQRKGWIATTIAETRNRADVVLIIGPDPSKAFHQLYAKVTPKSGRFFKGPRKIVFLGGEPTDEAKTQLEGSTVEIIAVPADGLVDALSRLATIVAGGSPRGGDLDLAPLAATLKSAHYPVLTWSASSIEVDGDLVVERAASVVDSLNVEGRAACLPLSGKDNLTGAYHASLWNIGFPLRIGFRDGVSGHDQQAYATENALKLADVAVWTSSFRPELPPASTAKLIALAHPATDFASEPAVFIPVGQPGLDHGGLVFRADSVVGLPLKKYRDVGLPSVEHVAKSILERLS